MNIALLNVAALYLTTSLYAFSGGVENDARKANVALSNDCTQAAEEYKRLKAVIDQLDQEYEDSKVCRPRVWG